MKIYIITLILLSFTQFSSAQKLVSQEKLDELPIVTFPVNNPKDIIKLSVKDYKWKDLRSLYSYSSIQELRLENCSFTILDLDLEKFPNLQFLFVYHCNYDSFSVKGKPDNFRTLDLYGRHFENYDFLPALTSLEEFNLSDTFALKIDNLIKNVNATPSIREFTIDELKEPLPESFKNIKKLNWLSLTYLDKSFDLPRLFELIQEMDIQTLNLVFGGYDSLPPEIAKLKKIKNLYIGVSGLTFLPDEIGMLEQLEGLYIAEAYSFKTLPSTLENMKNLKVLDLDFTAFTTVPDVIYKMTWLEKFYISGFMEELPESEIKKIKKALKKTAVN
ncbi:MAG: leucine-rich repeat domain-containing protein, partial [Bacteroidia bacterium]|nr:leucine-rich repeat domain-containing protein [Bacteroidia bacterium]